MSYVTIITVAIVNLATFGREGVRVALPEYLA